MDLETTDQDVLPETGCEKGSEILMPVSHVIDGAQQLSWDQVVQSSVRLLNCDRELVQIRATIKLGRIAKSVPEDILEQIVPHVVALLNHPSHSQPLSIQETASFCLGRLARRGEKLSSKIGDSGTLPILLRLLQESEEILSAMTSLKEVRRAIVGMHGIPVLIQSARLGRIASRARAAQAIGLLGVTRRTRRMLVNAGAIPALIELLREGDLAAKLVSGNALGIISAHVDYLRPVAQAGAIPLFAELLEGNDPQGKEIAEDVFSILAVAEENAIAIAEHLIRILQGSNPEAKAAAADVIWDLSSYKHTISVVRTSGAVPLLLRLLEDESDDVKEKVSGAVAQLSYDQGDRVALAEAGAIPILLSLLHDESEELKDNVAEALINFSEDPLLRDSISEAFNNPAFQDIQGRLVRIRQSDEHTVQSLRFMSLEQFTA
ncbi:hypothetical protein SUGI_0963280 [Cryptomeria japonica]|nr:hypothetical protein SUGI_0963280 [Cryptomeria japonica]